MALSSPSLATTNPLIQRPVMPTTGPALGQPVTPTGQPPLNPNPADQFTPSTAATTPDQAPTAGGPKPNAPAIRFGSQPQQKEDKKHSFGGFLKSAGSWTLGAASGIGLAVGVPLGLLQMAVGIVIHPLLITGALTMGLPVLGLIGAYLLGKK